MLSKKAPSRVLLHEIWLFYYQKNHYICSTKCRILRIIKYTKFNFAWGRRWGSLQRSPDPLAGFKGPASKGGRERAGKLERKGKVSGGKERGRERWEEKERDGGEGKGAYRDEGPLTKILSTPLWWSQHQRQLTATGHTGVGRVREGSSFPYGG